MTLYEQELTKELASRSRFAAKAQYFLFFLATSYTYFNSLWNKTNQLALFLFMIINTTRLTISQDSKNIKYLKLKLELLAGATALIWSLLFLSTVTHSNMTPTALGVMIFLIAGVTSSAVFSLSLSRKAVIIFVTPLIISMMSPFIMNYQNWRSDLIPIMIIGLFYIFVLGQQKKIFDAWYTNFQKKEELDTIFEEFPGGICLVDNSRIIKENTFIREAYTHLNKLEDFKNLSCTEHSTKSHEIIIEDKSTQISKHYLMSSHQIKNLKNKKLIFLFDIDDLKKAQTLLDKQKMMIAESNKMAALGEMSNGMAHEINNPLAIICTKSQLILNQLERGKKIDRNYLKNSMQKIYETGCRIGSIIKSLQDFSQHPISSQKEEINLQQIINNAVKLCKPILEKNLITVRFQTDSKILLFVQPSQLVQAIVNVLKNSIDATSKIEESNRWIEIESKQDSINGIALILIRDGGPGIPENNRHKIMNPFFTTKEIGVGIGLGLSVTKGLIEANDGKIYFNYSSKATELIIELKTSLHLKQSA